MLSQGEKKGAIKKRRDRMYGPPVAFHFYKHSIVIDEEYCTGCFACIQVCSHEVIAGRMVDGKKKAYVKHPDECIGCMKCFNKCQIKAITCTRKPKTG